MPLPSKKLGQSSDASTTNAGVNAYEFEKAVNKLNRYSSSEWGRGSLWKEEMSKLKKKNPEGFVLHMSELHPQGLNVTKK